MKNMWHLPNEEPNLNSSIIQRLDNGIDLIFFWEDIKIDGIPNIPMNNVIKWCYFEDYAKMFKQLQKSLFTCADYSIGYKPWEKELVLKDIHEKAVEGLELSGIRIHYKE